MKKSKRYSYILLGVTAIFLIIFGGITYYIDPLFHYHLPNKNYDYEIYDERYQNDGILRHYDYNAMVTGTSMTENFKPSDVNELFHVNAVKVPFYGGRYKEIDENIQRAISYQPNLKLVVRAIDYNYFFTDKDDLGFESSFYPEYLTNASLVDDVYYIFNKTIFFDWVLPTLRTYSKGNGTITSLDLAYNWMNANKFGKEAILENLEREERHDEATIITDEDIARFQANIDQNMIMTVANHPDIEFYYFLTPYSVLYWDAINRTKSMDRQLMGERMIIESLLEYHNVHIFSFSDDFDLTTNLDNYKDMTHYGEDINRYILEEMSKGNHQLTKSNYEDYLNKIETFYTSYDYDAIFE